MNSSLQDSLHWISQQEDWQHSLRLDGTHAQGRNQELQLRSDTAALRRQLPLSIFENARNAMAILNRQLACLYVNLLFAQYFKSEHISSEQPTMVPLPDLTPKWQKACQQALDGQHQELDENPFGPDFACSDLANWKCLPWYEPAGQVGGIIISAEKDSPARTDKAKQNSQLAFYAAALDQLPLGLALVSLSSCEIFWENRAFKHILASSDDALRTGLLPLCSQTMPDGQTAISHLEQARASARQTRQFTDSSGQMRWVDIKASSCDGTLAPDGCFWVTIEDITARKQLETER